MNDAILEFLNELHNKGISWGAVITVLILFNKIQRNKEFRLRDQRVERNQQRIMAKLGVIGEWDTPQKTLLQMVRPSLKKLYSSFYKDTQQGNQRRKKTMNLQNINYKTLVPTLIMGAKVVLDHFGYHIITDSSINTWVTDISTVGALVGIVMPHTKVSAISESVVQVLPDIQNTIHKVIADPNTSYAKMVPVITEVHTTLTALFEDMKKGKVTDSTREAMSAYLTFQAYLQSIKPASPVEPTVSATDQVGA